MKISCFIDEMGPPFIHYIKWFYYNNIMIKGYKYINAKEKVN